MLVKHGMREGAAGSECGRTYTDFVLRLTAGLALVAAIVWSCLLFGIGLDDLTSDHTRPGVIFSVVVLPLVILGAAYVVARLVRRRTRTVRSDRS